MFTLNTTAGPLDLIAEVPGVGTFEDVLAASRAVEMFERQVFTLDLRALIASKRATGRPKDLEILPELESLLEAAGE
jgi:hypothetical protein